MALNRQDREIMKETAEAIGALFDELMQLKPTRGPGVRGGLFTPEQAAAIAGSCGPDILDNVSSRPRRATQARPAA